ncbi:MAG: alpha/beta hydrolase [Bacteroidetes bacterium]|nr:alpha/beta hydrolase [Bacteroidota bacterium]
MKAPKPLVLLFATMVIGSSSFSQNTTPKKMENIVYGMVSGTALLMDVYVPIKPNHKAIIFIPGSAWGFVYPSDYNQEPLKDDITLDSAYMGKWGKALVQNGYTLFVVNHRFTPKFQYQDIIEDCRRAVRFVRYHANEYKIDPVHIGAMGHSSGANLAAMIGVADDKNTNSKSPVDSVSSKVQAVVTLAAPFNLADINKHQDSIIANDFLVSVLAAYMGSLPQMKDGKFVLSGKYIDASPFALVTKNSAPTLIYYSDNDPVIAVRQGKDMYEKLLQNNVPVKIFASHNAGHTPTPDMSEICKWFEKYLN